MSPNERKYYRERALIERDRASTATSVAAPIHLELACLYEKLVELEDGHEVPILRVVGSKR
jgi:hypothetical protein